MNLLALLVSSDDTASASLGRVLASSGIALERFSDVSAAIDRLRQQKFDALILDFEDANAAARVFEEGRKLNSGNNPMTVALVAVRSRTRDILSGGAHFVLYKPISEATAAAGLRAVTALLTRERRRAYRVPVQAPVELVLPGGRTVEGILLDLSESGMDVLAAEEQNPGALINFSFKLPNSQTALQAHAEVAWAKANGQTGVRFIELDESTRIELQSWLAAAAALNRPSPEETVPHCKLTDLSLGGCYLETDSPFPERALVDLCLSSGVVSVHSEGMVRVVHPGYGMGVEFPSRTAAQRTQVANLIDLLRSKPQAEPEMSVSPQQIRADATQFEPRADPNYEAQDEDMDDPLLDLLRQGTTMQQETFLEALRDQRYGVGTPA